ncbi:hypothetical protein JCM8097_009270 [Rhodosporidiobolus ruineniae]
MSKRSRPDPLDNPKGPKIRGLTFTDNKPAFLRNAMAALAGQSSRGGGGGGGGLGPDGRPAIPTRPGEGSGDEDDEEDQDEWDLGRGDEAPAVVVLKEGKHISKHEVERLRADAKASNASDPLTTADSAPSAKKQGSLAFSSGSSSKSKPQAGGGGNGDWADVLKGAASGKESEVKRREGGEGAKPAAAAPKLSKEEQAKLKEKDEKRKKKEKKKDAAKIKKLSFEDE